MPLETKFLRLRTPVTIGSRFGDWEVSWLGGWTRNRLCYLVMVVHVPLCGKLTNSRRSVDGSHVRFRLQRRDPADPMVSFEPPVQQLQGGPVESRTPRIELPSG